MSESAPASNTQSQRVGAAASYNRRRASGACLVCRSRKTKCDNQRPKCGFCISTGGDCRYVDLDYSQLDRSSLTILQRISQLEASLINHFDTALKDRTWLAANAHSSNQSRELYNTASRPHGYSVTPEHSEGLIADQFQERSPGETTISQYNIVSPATTLSKDVPPSAEVLLHASGMSVESILRWPIYSNAAPHLAAALTVPLVEVVGQPEPNFHSSLKNGVQPGFMFPDLNPDIINRLVQNFLNNNHAKNPILDVDALWVDARVFAETGPQWDTRSCLLLLVCAVSTLSAPLGDELTAGVSKQKDKILMAENYFQASQRRIGMTYHENSLMGAQCSFLTAVYLMSTFRILAAWKCFIQAGSQCLAWLSSQGRLAHDGKLNTTTFNEENRFWQRNKTEKSHYIEGSLYWSCLKSEMEVRFHLKLPGSGLGEIDYLHLHAPPPKEVPNTCDQTGESSSEPRLLASSQSSINFQNLQLGWYFYLAEIALKRITNNLLDWQYNTKSHQESLGRASREKRLELSVIEFERQLEAWYQVLPAEMKFSPRSDMPANNIFRLILRGHLIDVKDGVLFPAVEEVLALSPHIPLTNLSPIMLGLTRRYLEVAAESVEANQESFYHRHQGTWLMARTCTRSSIILLGMAMRCQEEARSAGTMVTELEDMVLPSRWRKVVDQTRQMLKYWSDESNDLSRLCDLLNELLYAYEQIT